MKNEENIAFSIPKVHTIKSPFFLVGNTASIMFVNVYLFPGLERFKGNKDNITYMHIR
jgi:hypothetical protein